MSYDNQCSYITNSSEPDHTYNCRLNTGHYGPHEDYTGDQDGYWYVKSKACCSECGSIFDEREIRWVEPYGLPPVDQKGRVK